MHEATNGETISSREVPPPPLKKSKKHTHRNEGEQTVHLNFKAGRYVHEIGVGWGALFSIVVPTCNLRITVRATMPTQVYV